MPKGDAALAVPAALLLNPVFGSLYAWSVFVAPLEPLLGVSRAEISLVFSVAVICFTAGAVLAPLAYRAAPAWALILGCVGIAAGGLVLSADAAALWPLTFGYGALFGFGAGAGYSLTLQLINLALPHRRGLANGLGIGSFALGSIASAVLLAWSIEAFGVRATFVGMAAALVAIGALAALLAGLSRLALPQGRAPVAEGEIDAGRLFRRLWAGFALAAFAGLMAIGHAAPIVASYGGSAALAVIGTAAISIGNAGGRIAAGILSDYLPAARVAMAAHAIAALGFVLLAVGWGPLAAVVALVMEGLAYGLASGVYPTAVAMYFGVERYGRYFGRLMTAWGVAGLAAPWLAGRLFELSGGYGAAALVGALAGLGALLVAGRLPRKKRPL